MQLPEWKYLKYELQERWERLGLRKHINDNPKIVIGVTIASAIVLLIVVAGLLMPAKTIKVKEYKKAWFYDLNTDKLFVAKSSRIAPIEAPSGPLPNGEPAGVKAYVFSYASEPNESNRFIGFLETVDPNAEEDSSSVDSETGRPKPWGYGKLIRRPEDEEWVPGNSKQGRAILKEVLRPDENGETPSSCPPK